MSEKKHMKLSSHHERRHRDKFFIYCKHIQMFTLAALHFDNFNSERGSKDLIGCSDQFWNTHEGPWLGSHQLCSIISRHKLERLPELSLPW